MAIPVTACEADFTAHTKEMFVDQGQRGDIAAGGRPARRAVFRKAHGVASGSLVLYCDRPDWTRRGIFAGDSYKCWVRFSSDVAPDADDAGNGTIGIGIKLFGTASGTLAGIDPGAPTADLLLQNHDVFFVDTGMDMCVFTDLAIHGREKEWYADHPETERILGEMLKREESVLTTTFWSGLPYACGAGTAIKYRLSPTATGASQAPDADPNRLRSDLKTRLDEAPSAYTLEMQRPNAGAKLDIDRATIPWPEADAPFVAIGTLTLDRQDVSVEGQEIYGDNLAFSPWRVPEENRPLGTIAASRRVTYPASAALRHAVNGVPEAEPHSPRTPGAV